MKKRVAILIAAVMLFTSMPFYAFAGEEIPTDETDQTEVITGWNGDHTIYYDNNGVPLTNTVKKIQGVYYYFNKKGKLDMSNGWKTVGKNKYYVKKGKIVTKPIKIKNKKKVSYLYMFEKNGKLKTTKGLFKYKGKEYYGLGKGRLKTGWQAFTEKKKHKAAFFNKKTGAMVKNKKVGYLIVPKNGRLGEAYYLGIKNLDKIGWSLRKAYRYSSRIRYQGRSYRAKDSETYAIKGFTKGYGNCYVMAATFYIQAKLLGYDVHQVAGRVDLPHSWTVIKQDGREWVYDPNFTNETGRNGWKIRYGQKGTWRYNHYHKMN